jgi:hypothetical protein
MPIGYLVTVMLAAACTVLALAPPRPRHSNPSNTSYWFGYLISLYGYYGPIDIDGRLTHGVRSVGCARRLVAYGDNDTIRDGRGCPTPTTVGK